VNRRLFFQGIAAAGATSLLLQLPAELTPRFAIITSRACGQGTYAFALPSEAMVNRVVTMTIFASEPGESPRAMVQLSGGSLIQ
jgi:hypothetical protein